jgi:predicted ATPase/transcriptional regulator with XRE-family HTH domain
MLQFLCNMEETDSALVFSDWLKLRRKALDLTQDELAGRAGCSVGALRKIESGARRPSKQLAALLAKALEIPQEEVSTFVRVARGDLNLERLRPTRAETRHIFPDLSQIRRSPGEAFLQTAINPTSDTTRIPLQTTPLIGRETELDALVRIFNDPQCRLLTLTGIGGIGKTRLAIEYALREISSFPGGVFYIPLTSVNSPDKIIPAIADVLAFTFSGLTDPKEQLLHYIAASLRQEALLIFDNMEHLLGVRESRDENSGAVELVSEILQRLPSIKILATSRERLNLRGEWTYELHGLSVPPVDYAGRLEDYYAVALFLKSAQRNRADFQIALGEWAALVQICQMVEGVPLAIELAAAWVGLLSCNEIAQEIKANMDFLATSMRDIPERHRSIRATFDHSWKLIPEEEQRALCRLSVFQGGFDRSAADQIAGASLPILASLNDKSLVRRTKDGRYDLHEVIRQYTLSNLRQRPSGADTYRRHCEYYLNLLRTQEGKLKGAHQQDAMRQLTDEIDNFRAAWVWGVQNNQFSLLEEAGRAFGWYFEIAGLYQEGIEQLELLQHALQAAPHKDQWSRLTGLAVNHQALLYFRKGEFSHALELFEKSVAILRPIGDQTLLADGLIFQGTILHLIGDYPRARLSIEEGLTFAQAARNQWFEAYAIYNLGYLDSLSGDYKSGYEQMIMGLAMWRTLGDPQSIALGLNFIIPTLNQMGCYEQAISFMQESIALCEQSKNRWGLGTAHRYMGLALMAKGDLNVARFHIQQSLGIFGGFAEGWDIGLSLTYLADISRLSESFTEAAAIYQDALRVSFEANAIPIALQALLGFCKLKAQSGEKRLALMLCVFILNHAASENETRSQAHVLRSNLESDLRPEQIEASYAAARRSTLEKIIQEELAAS